MNLLCLYFFRIKRHYEWSTHDMYYSDAYIRLWNINVIFLQIFLFCLSLMRQNFIANVICFEIISTVQETTRTNRLLLCKICHKSIHLLNSFQGYVYISDKRLISIWYCQMNKIFTLTIFQRIFFDIFWYIIFQMT